MILDKIRKTFPFYVEDYHSKTCVYVCKSIVCVEGLKGCVFVCVCSAGSSSSALGLQSLGLSGQAPSSSSLDAGTLSDTTASGNQPLLPTVLSPNTQSRPSFVFH